MRTSRVYFEEQYRLVMECRQSGITDYQWCLERNIKASVGTFYNWVKEPYERGYDDTLFHERLKSAAVYENRNL